MKTKTLATCLVVGAVTAAPSPAWAQAISKQYTSLTLAVFAVIIAITMYVTYLAAKRTKTTADFYAAAGGVSGAASAPAS